MLIEIQYISHKKKITRKENKRRKQEKVEGIKSAYIAGNDKNQEAQTVRHLHTQDNDRRDRTACIHEDKGSTKKIFKRRRKQIEKAESKPVRRILASKLRVTGPEVSNYLNNWF